MKFHIICALPNASTNINGIDFEMIEEGSGPDGVNTVQTKDPVDEEAAAGFRGIHGYTVVPVPESGDPVAALTPPQTAAQAAVAAILAGDAPRRGRGRPPKAKAPTVITDAVEALKGEAEATEAEPAEESAEDVVESAEAASPAESDAAPEPEAAEDAPTEEAAAEDPATEAEPAEEAAPE